MKDTASAPQQGRSSAAAFKVGAIALAFLIIGYQAALFTTHAARLRLEANRDHPDTVFIYAAPPEGAGESAASTGTARPAETTVVRRSAPHSGFVEQYRRATRRVESFRFNPNTVSIEDLMRLGFSEKQARAIDNYRRSGGHFRRREDFARSFVVADSVYRRLERFIDIPLLDLNAADSTALDALPGIGPYYAAQIIQYRGELGGYSFPEQLMDIYRFDREKYDALADLVFCSPPQPFALWTLPADSLAAHPYIRSRQAARSIVLFRDNTPREEWTVEALGAAGILPAEQVAKLARCAIAEPVTR